MRQDLVPQDRYSNTMAETMRGLEAIGNLQSTLALP